MKDEEEEDKVVETTTDVVVEPKSEDAVTTWQVVDDKPEVHTSFIEQPKDDVVIEPKADDVIVEPKVEEPKADEIVTPTIDDALVLNYLKEKGIDAKDFEDLKPKEKIELDAETEKYLEYKKETNGRSYSDFLATQKEWKDEPKENVLKALMKAEKPYLKDSDIELLLEDKYGIEELDEYATDTEKRANRLKEIALEDDYQKGLQLLESQKEKYMVRRGSDENVPEDFKKAKEIVDNWQKQQKENEVIFEETRKDFQAKTDSVFTKDFEGFKVKVGEQEFSIKPENIESAKSTLSDLSNFDKMFFDETGKLTKPQEYYKALHFAMNTDKVAEHFINIGKALQAEEEDKASKNIVIQGAKNIQTGSNGKKWSVSED